MGEELKFVFTNLLDRIIQLFPVSPFRNIIAQAASVPYLGYINWFLPISEIIALLEAWVAAILVYYLYSVIARWVKLVS